MALVRTLHGAPQDKTAGTSYAPTLGVAAVPVGSLAVLAIACDNSAGTGSSPIVSVNDARGHTWTQQITATQDPGAADAGTTLEVWTTRVTTQIEIGDAITISFGSTSVTAKTVRLVSWASDTGGMLATLTGGKNTAVGSGTAPTITTDSITSGQAVHALVASETDTAGTGDADTTNGSWSAEGSSGTTGGGAASNMRLAFQSKITTGTGTQTYNPTIVSSDFVIGWLGITEELVPPRSPVFVVPSQAAQRASRW